MKQRVLSLSILGVLVLLIFVSYRQMSLSAPAKAFSDSPQLLSDVQKIFPQASFCQANPDKEQWSLVFDAQKKPIGKVIFTKPFIEKQGYAGIVHLCIGAGLDNRITGIALVDHEETPDVVEFLTEKKFFTSWNGLDVAQSLDKKVDAVTGATITTQAVIEAMQKRLSLLSKDAACALPPAPGIVLSWKDLLALAALAFSFFMFSQKLTTRVWRLVLLGVNVIVFGFLTTKMFSLSLFDRWITEGVHGFEVPFLIFILTVIIALASNKNFYCTHVCPFGSLQEILGSLHKKKIVVSYWQVQIWHGIKIVYLGLIAGLVIGGAGIHLHFFEPFFTFTMASVPATTLGIFIIFLAVSLFSTRFWCQFICPTGTVIRSFLKREGPISKGFVVLVALFLLCASVFVFAKVKLVKETFVSVQTAEAQASYHLASFFKSLAKGMVACELCPQKCVIKDGSVGFCRARKNINGKLYALTYGEPVALHVDPIEKKPFAHVFPGTKSFSLATAGCNLRCKFCQNWEISQLDADKVDSAYVEPEAIVMKAKETGSKTIAFTYTEPVIFYEYMLDIAKAAQKEGIACVMHSAGFVNEEPLRAMSKYLLAANIDLKGFDERFYESFTSGHLETVLKTLKILKEEGVWVEITNLLIPGANDSDDMITNLCTWVKENLGPQTPVHFSRFYPMYKLINLSPTPVDTLKRAYDIAKKAGLEFVYIGNVPGMPGEDTFCPVCGRLLIKREGYTVLENHIASGHCPACQYRVPGVWN